MPKIEITTIINAPIERCFDLATSIDMHTISTSKTKEKAIAGRTSGLAQLNDTVTWQATHFGIKQNLTSLISAFDRPHYFKDDQVRGAFKSFHHEHIFELKEDVVTMKDIFEYVSPFGIIGRIFNDLVLTSYLHKFLTNRNNIIKFYAETDEWKKVLHEK
jgi:ligand-binding SRPBCC domain-containing protein